MPGNSSSPRGDDPPTTAIAVIGMAGRFPGARDLEALWRNLRDGVESITFFDEAEMSEIWAIAPAERARLVRARGMLEDIESFDADFFGYGRRDAAMIDPQHRLFLECAHTALEAAGRDPARATGRIGVYAGAGLNAYFLNNIARSAAALREYGWTQLRLGNRVDHLATRVSYKLNLRGAALTLQTNCSTSLVAVHVACQALLHGECDLALAGGVAIHVPQQTPHVYREGGIGSIDGHCRAFDAEGTGFSAGNGVGVVALARLEDAIAQGDHIHATILGSAVNNDGATKVGYAAPSVGGQAEIVAEAMALAQVEPESIASVEAHGTATPLGDPVEFAALVRAFGATRRRQYCALGSIKSNIGHLDAAAGIAGLIKTVLALEQRQIPPSLHFRRPNPGIDLDNSPFFVNTQLRDWPADRGPRRAGVSSFGIGGTNAHVVLEEAPRRTPPPREATPQLIVLSARSARALEAGVANLSRYLVCHRDQSLADIAYTLQVGRRACDQRRYVVGRTVDDVLAGLQGASTPLPAGDLLPEAYGAADEEMARLASVGARWQRGEAIAWESLHRGVARWRVPLPTYPFERVRCWIEPDPAPPAVQAAGGERPTPQGHARDEASLAVLIESQLDRMGAQLDAFDDGLPSRV